MPSLSNLTTAWGLVSEMDLQPLRKQVDHPPSLAVVGRAGSGRQSLVANLRHDPARKDVEVASPVHVLTLDQADALPRVDLCILLMDAGQDDQAERLLVRKWLDAGVQVLVIINQPVKLGVSENELLDMGRTQRVESWTAWGKQNVLVGSLDDTHFLLSEFVPAVMRLLPEHHLALGRYFPLFRVPVARHLIHDSSTTNAAYSLSTGVIEIIPILNIPLNVADIVILTKNQLFLVFKLGLALGMSTTLQPYLSAFGGVLGVGFFWRQVARMLVGLIPAWGILPKVGVAYAGTFVVGNAVLQWYVTGRHISKEQMRRLYAQAYTSGKRLASRMKPRLPRLPWSAGKQKASPRKVLPQSAVRCSVCGAQNPAEALNCQDCGKSLIVI
ncbi:MAG: hypothetical protein ACWGO1_08320 [Anaerolineales bacterium]